MLKHIPPILSPELLLCLMQMGHGDELVIADGNYPSESNAQRILRADGHAAVPLIEAILKFLPVDTFVDDVAVVMRPVDKQAPEPPIWTDFRRLLRAAEGREIPLTMIDRDAFYHRSRSAYAILATGETALYANLIIKKGVVAPS